MGYEKENLEIIKAQIEKKLAWGSSNNWQNQDFEVLSEQIFDEIKVQLSVSTLKRVWGKVKYEGTPNTATLNALAQFAGHKNWRFFIGENDESITGKGALEKGDGAEIIIKIKLISIFKRFGWGVLVAVLLIFIGVLWAFRKMSKPLTFSNVQFTSKPVTRGVPNTVIFQYNATDSNADSVFIQQSWDPKRRFKVNKNLHEYTSTYYIPGYFRAKLILNDSVVKEHDVFIESNGWLGTIDREPIPIYLTEGQVNKDGVVGVNEADLTQHKIDLTKEHITTTLHFVSKKYDVSSDHFILDTELKNTFTGSLGVCKKVDLFLLGTRGAIGIPLSIKGCVGELSMFFNDRRLDGKTFDFSKFGVDFEDFVKLQCEVKNNKILIRINGVIAYESDFKQSFGKIVGTRIRFEGTGTIQRFDLR